MAYCFVSRYAFYSTRLKYTIRKQTEVRLPSNRRRCVALYACLSFCSCFSIFLFASLRISSSSSVLPARKQPIPPVTNTARVYPHQQSVRRVRPSNERARNSLTKGELCVVSLRAEPAAAASLPQRRADQCQLQKKYQQQTTDIPAPISRVTAESGREPWPADSRQNNDYLLMKSRRTYVGQTLSCAAAASTAAAAAADWMATGDRRWRLAVAPGCAVSQV